MAAVLVCNKCGAINWNLSSAGASHARLADEVKGYEACDGIWQQGRWPQLRLIAGHQDSKDTRQAPTDNSMNHPRVTLSLGVFEQLLAHAPGVLAQQAMTDAARAITAMCFTEADIWHHCEEDKRWSTLSPETQAEFVDDLLDCGEYEYVAETAHEAIAEVVERYLDDELSSS